MTIIVNGEHYPARFSWPLETDDMIMFAIYTNLALFEIARVFENAAIIEKKSETEGDAVFLNTGRVLRAIRPNADKEEVQITIERSRRA